MTERKEYQNSFDAFAVPALVLAFVMQPVLARYSSEHIYGLGAVLLIAVFICERFVFPRPNGWGRAVIVLPTFLAAFVILLWFLTPEQLDATANDKRCLAIQKDMLSPHPLRSDAPDLFQALGCRPQGEGSVHAPPSEQMIEVHEWLPWGGLP